MPIFEIKLLKAKKPAVNVQPANKISVQQRQMVLGA